MQLSTVNVTFRFQDNERCTKYNIQHAQHGVIIKSHAAYIQ